MNRDRRGRFGTLLGLALGLATLFGAVAGAQAQQTPAPAAPGAAAGTEAKVTLDLRDVPFRTAIEALFGPTGLQYAIDPTTPNYPITVSLRDVDFPTALRVILRQGQATYRKESSIYMVGPKAAQTEQLTATPEVTPEPPPESTTAEQTWEKIPIQFQNATLLGLAFGAVRLPTEDQIVAGGTGGYGMMNGSGYGGYGTLGGGGIGGYGGLGNTGGYGGLGGYGGAGGLGGYGSGIGGYGGLGGYGGGIGGYGGLGNTGGLVTGPIARVRGRF